MTIDIFSLFFKRIFDDVTVASSGTTLSDHFGVEVILKNIRSKCEWWESRQYYCLPPTPLEFLQLPAPQAELNRLCAAADD